MEFGAADPQNRLWLTTNSHAAVALGLLWCHAPPGSFLCFMAHRATGASFNCGLWKRRLIIASALAIHVRFARHWRTLLGYLCRCFLLRLTAPSSLFGEANGIVE